MRAGNKTSITEFWVCRPLYKHISMLTTTHNGFRLWWSCWATGQDRSAANISYAEQRDGWESLGKIKLSSRNHTNEPGTGWGVEEQAAILRPAEIPESGNGRCNASRRQHAAFSLLIQIQTGCASALFVQELHHLHNLPGDNQELAWILHELIQESSCMLHPGKWFIFPDTPAVLLSRFRELESAETLPLTSDFQCGY